MEEAVIKEEVDVSIIVHDSAKPNVNFINSIESDIKEEDESINY